MARGEVRESCRFQGSGAVHSGEDGHSAPGRRRALCFKRQTRGAPVGSTQRLSVHPGEKGKVGSSLVHTVPRVEGYGINTLGG